MCTSEENSRMCGVCVKLKNLLKIHYKFNHKKYELCITITKRLRKRAKALSFSDTDEFTENIEPPESEYALQTGTEEVLNVKSIKTENNVDSVANATETEQFRDYFDEEYGNNLSKSRTDTDTSGTCKVEQRLPEETELPEMVSQDSDDDTIGERFSCFCGDEFDTVKELRIHDSTHTASAYAMFRPHSCDICERRFKSRDGLIKHKKTAHNVHECSCGASFPSLKELKVHKRTHDGKTESRPFSCNICNRRFKHKAKLRNHKKSHIKHDCDICGMSFSSPKELKCHSKLHKEDPDAHPYSCETCNRGFKREGQLRRHKASHGLHECICGDTFPNSEELEKHKFATHSLETFDCSHCEKKFPTRKQLLKHLRSIDPERQFVCRVCQESFKSKSELSEHKSVHVKIEQSHLCEDCGKNFKNLTLLKSHRLVHITEKPFHCSYCDKSFVRQSNLREHERTHTDERRFTCEYCGSAFNSSFSLQSHIRIHTGQKPYKCDQCDYAARQSSTLSGHKMLHHSDVRKYPCTLCNKKFIKASYLRNHMNNHKGIKPHVCDKCNKSFVTRGKLNRHFATHSEERPHKCKLCPSAYKRKADLDIHTKRHHDGPSSTPVHRRKLHVRPAPATDEGQTSREDMKFSVPQMPSSAAVPTFPTMPMLEQQDVQGHHPMFGSPARNSMQNPPYGILHPSSTFFNYF